MKKRHFIKAIPALIVLIFVICILLWKMEVAENGDDQYEEAANPQTVEEDTEHGNVEEPTEDDANITDTGNQFLAEKKVKEKAELMDYAELPIEEFIRETGIPLCQDQDDQDSWSAEDGLIIVEAEVKDGSIVNLSIWVKSRGQSEEAKRDAVERFPYVLGGVNLNEDISLLEKNVLKNASIVSGEGPGYYYYTGIELSGLGIERLTIMSAGTTADTIKADVDMSLKEMTEGLTYIWGEKVNQKEGSRNDKLEVSENPYTELPGYYAQQEKIDQTVVWIKYPCIAIPENPEMAQNVNGLILETVERIENETYGKIDENVIVQADYMITYMTGKFVSITFRVNVTGNDTEETPWQYCNINMEKNGEKAVLSDIGITRDDVLEACNACWYQVDTESYMEAYDTNWNQFQITPVKYVLYVKPSPEDKELSAVKDVIPIEIFRI